MENDCIQIAYEQTGFFSKLVSDYVSGKEQLQPFYSHSANIEGIKEAINARQQFKTDRSLLVNELTKQYAGIALSSIQENNLNALLSPNTFTITTAHQPNIFTGPLYFIYKIIHTIKLADELKKQLPQYTFVPFYYMGSEDADLDELGYINIDGKKLVWHTKQTGAVGRMVVDKPLLQLIDEIKGQINVHPFGADLTTIFSTSYTLGKTIQQATLELVDALFKQLGLLVVIPDNTLLKASFNSVIEKEITEQFSHKAVAKTIENLSTYYKVQAAGRDINLFYFLGDKRERIIQLPTTNGQVENHFQVVNLNLTFTQTELLAEVKNYPERFSANVILRGVFQETILPNIAFIGGGGELAYWLELKQTFAAAQVPYPVLIVRNSFLLVNDKQQKRLQKLGIAIPDFFKPSLDIINNWVQKNTSNQLGLNDEIASITQVFETLQNKAASVDSTLTNHTKALQTKALSSIKNLEKKILRAEKRKFADQQQQIITLKNILFPNQNLQEREDNFSIAYAKEGQKWLEKIYTNSPSLEQVFTILIER